MLAVQTCSVLSGRPSAAEQSRLSQQFPPGSGEFVRQSNFLPFSLFHLCDMKCLAINVRSFLICCARSCSSFKAWFWDQLCASLRFAHGKHPASDQPGICRRACCLQWRRGRSDQRAKPLISRLLFFWVSWMRSQKPPIELALYLFIFMTKSRRGGMT